MTFTERDTVVFSKETERFLEQLDVLSNNSLVHRKEIGTLLELSRSLNVREQLAELAFAAKFCRSSYSIMKRIGPEAEGYDRLMSEFNENAVKSLGAIKGLLEHSSDEDRTQFDEKFFASTQVSLQARLDLYHDMSWIKNRLIDHNTGIPL